MAKVKADYSRKCEVCGATPVVNVSGMCGPCTFGEADCLDPDEWEGEYDELERAEDNPND